MKVQYSDHEWKPVGDSMLADCQNIGPSCNDIWLYYPKGSIVCRYINWSGWKVDVEKLKLEGATMWAPVVSPSSPAI